MMENSVKRILAFVLVLCMLVPMCAPTVTAAGSSESSAQYDFQYDAENGTDVFGADGKTAIDALYNAGKINWTPYGSNVQNVLFQNTESNAQVTDVAQWDGISASGATAGEYLALCLKNPGKGTYELVLNFRKAADGVKNADAYLIPDSALSGTTVDALIGDDTYKLTTSVDFVTGYENAANASVSFGDIALDTEDRYILVLKVTDAGAGFMGIRSMALYPNDFIPERTTYSFGGGASSTDTPAPFPLETEMWSVPARGTSFYFYHLSDRIQANSFSEGPKIWFVVKIKNSDVGRYNFTLTGDSSIRAAEVYLIEKPPVEWNNDSVAGYTRENASYMGILDNSKTERSFTFTADVNGDFYLLFKGTNEVADNTLPGGHFKVCSLVKEETRESAAIVYNLGYDAANKTDVFGSRGKGIEKLFNAGQSNWMPLASSIDAVQFMSTTRSAGSEKTADWDGILANGTGVGAWIGLKVKNPGLSNCSLSIGYHRFENGAQSANVYLIPGSALSGAAVGDLIADDTYKLNTVIDFHTGYATESSATVDLGAVDFGTEEYGVLVFKATQAGNNNSAVMGIESLTVNGSVAADYTAQYPFGNGGSVIRLSSGTQLDNFKVYRGNFTFSQRANDLSATNFTANEGHWFVLEIQNTVAGNFEMLLRASSSSARAGEVYLISEAPSEWSNATAAAYTPSNSSYQGILDCSTAQTRQLTLRGNVNGTFWLLFKGSTQITNPNVSGGNFYVQSLSITQLPEERSISCNLDADIKNGTQVFDLRGKHVIDGLYEAGTSIWTPYGTNIEDVTFCSTTAPVVTEQLASWDGISADGFGVGSWIAFKLKNPGKGLYELAIDYQKSAFGAQSVNAYLLPASALANTTIEALTADDTYKLDATIDFKTDYQYTPSATADLGTVELGDSAEYIIVLRVAKTRSESALDSAYMGLKSISLTPPISELLNKTYSFGGGTSKDAVSMPVVTNDWTVVQRGNFNMHHLADRIQANSFGAGDSKWFVVEIKNNVADTLDFVLTGGSSARAAEIYVINEAPAAWDDDTAVKYTRSSDAYVGIMDNSTAEGRVLRFTKEVNGNFFLLFKATDEVAKPETTGGHYKVVSLNVCQTQEHARITYDLGYDTANATNALDTACTDAMAKLYSNNRINWQLFQTNMDNIQYYSTNITADGKILTADWNGIAVNAVGTGKWFAAKLKNPGTGYYQMSLNLLKSLDGAKAASVYLIPESKLSGTTVEALIGSNEYKVYSNLNFNGTGAATVTTNRIHLSSTDAYILVVKAETTCNGSATNKVDAAYMQLQGASFETVAAPKSPNAVYQLAPYGSTIPGTSTVLKSGTVEKYAKTFENAYRSGEWNWKYHSMNITFDQENNRATFRPEGHLRVYSKSGEWIAFTIKSPGEGVATVGVNIPVIGASCASEIGVYILPADTADVPAAIANTANRVGVYDAEPHGGLIAVGTMNFQEDAEYIVVFKVESDGSGSDYIYLRELIISQNFVPKAEYPVEEPPIVIVPGAVDKAAAEAVQSMISSIGSNITLASQTKIEDARFAYDCLTDAQKAMVTNYDVLLAAEAELDALLGSENQKYADPVIALIDAIGVVTLESADAIKAARDAYSELTGAQAALVTNYDVLVAAEAKLRELQDDSEKGPTAQDIFDQAAADTVEALIDAIGTVTLDSEYAISAARNAYNALTNAQSVLVENYNILVAAEGTFAELKAAQEAELAAEQKAKHMTIMVITAAAVVLSVAGTLFIVPQTRKKILSLIKQ